MNLLKAPSKKFQGKICLENILFVRKSFVHTICALHLERPPAFPGAHSGLVKLVLMINVFLNN